MHAKQLDSVRLGPHKSSTNTITRVFQGQASELPCTVACAFVPGINTSFCLHSVIVYSAGSLGLVTLHVPLS